MKVSIFAHATGQRIGKPYQLIWEFLVQYASEDATLL